MAVQTFNLIVTVRAHEEDLPSLMEELTNEAQRYDDNAVCVQQREDAINLLADDKIVATLPDPSRIAGNRFATIAAAMLRMQDHNEPVVRDPQFICSDCNGVDGMHRQECRRVV